ncbi:hypothetical protein N431DRAFT_478474 [Stipitochalara longipes BDJ]|nr:hypothetical protein N431DRAFT_478474 [Stipitochalara longipes BDJ]
MSSCPQVNCANALQAPPPLEPNPDISGIGVLVGFFATALLSWILLVVHYIWVFDPAEAGLPKEKRKENALDKIILEFIAKGFDRPEKTKKIWEDALEKMVLMMSDQQMITGIALMVSAITQLNCGISAYHWQITIYLVWFSSFTHLATLTFLRGYLHENSPMRWWRLFFMTALIGLLIAALVPTGRGDWLPDNQPSMSGAPALCIFSSQHQGQDTTSLVTMLFSILVLCISYTTRAIKLFKWSSEASRRIIRTIPGTAVRKHLEMLYNGGQNMTTNKWIFSIPYCIILAVYLVVRSWMDFLESMFWEILWLLIALAWGTLRLLSTRSTTIEQDNNILEENFWGFGQCLSTAMVLLLLFSSIETYIETRRRLKKSSSSDSGSVNSSSTSTVDNNEGRVSSTSDGSQNSSAASETSSVNQASAENARTADITDHGAVATGIDEQLLGVTRSATALSLEERTMETFTSQHNQARHSISGIELPELSHAAPADPEPHAGLRDLAPHERDYYDDDWYKGLFGHNLILVLLLSGSILITAPSHGDARGIFGSVRDVGSMVLHLLNWILIYVPLSSIMITLPNVLLQYTQDKGWKKRFNTMANRRLAGIFSFYEAIALAFVFVMFTSELIFPLEYALPYGADGMIVALFYSPILLVFSAWYAVIFVKIRREARS